MTSEPKQDASHASQGLPYLRFIPIALVITGLAIGYAMGLQHYFTLGFLADSRDSLKAFVADNPALSAIGFFFVYAIAVAVSFPAASVLTIFGGFLFGWLVGGAIVALSATTGATILFLAAKSAFGDFLRKRVGGFADRFSKGFQKNAFTYLLILRLAPVFPFFVVNIAPALFGVRVGSFVGATLLGILPGTFAYAYLGQGVDSVLVAAKNSGRDATVSELVTPEITIAFAVLALVATVPLIVKKLRGARPA